MLSVVKLNIVMLSVVKLSVVVPEIQLARDERSSLFLADVSDE